jgi:hypothetical protein
LQPHAFLTESQLCRSGFFAHGGRGIIINNISIGGRIPMPWAATYSATKYGLAGFTDALRDELAAHSDIRVCGVYPPFVDTPTNVHSPNYTGRALRPVPPVVYPERVAEVMVELAVHPHRSVRIGAAHALAAPYWMAPDWTGKLIAALGRRFLLQSGPLAPPSSGSLFEPVMDRGRIRGGWGEPERSRAKRNLALVALAGLSILAVVRHRSQA